MAVNVKDLIAQIGTDTSGKWMSIDNAEKFAELIVRECSNIACEYDAPKMSGPGMIIAGRIETHFGVKE